MNTIDFESPRSHIPAWRDWTWQSHPLNFVFPAAMMVMAAPLGAKGIAEEVARLICWISALGLQILLCPRKPLAFDTDDPVSQMKIWPLGLWHDGSFDALWRLTDTRASRIFAPCLGNAAVGVVSAIALGILGVQMTWNPFVNAGPWDLDGQPVEAWSTLWWLGQFGHAHWILALAAVIPAKPLAGGLGLRLLLDTFQWSESDARQIRRIVAWTSIIFLSLLGVTLVVNEHDGGYCVMLVALIITLETRKQAKRDAAEAFIENFVQGVIDEDEFGDGLDQLDASQQSFRSRFEAWRSRRNRLKTVAAQERSRVRQLQEEQRLDAILDTIGRNGLDSLPWSDRRFLKRFSKSLRVRRERSGSGSKP